MPIVENVPVVSAALANVTVPGPLLLLQVWVSVEFPGQPSSLTAPSGLAAEAGSAMNWLLPASTCGAVFYSVSLSAGPVPDGV